MNRILLGLVMVVGITAAVAGTAGALFTSTASNNGNTFGSGTLTLTINGLPDAISTPVFAVANAAPGDTATQILALENTGSIDADNLLLTSVDVTDTSGTPGSNLGDELNTIIWEDTNSDGVVDGGEPVWVNNVALTAIPANINLGDLDAAMIRNFSVMITFDVTADNTYQGRSISFDFNFQANQ